MHSLFTIGSSFDSTQPVSNFIATYKSEWASLSTLSASGGESPYRNKLNDFLTCNEAKRDILLSILIPHMSNVIDNFTTKQTMAFNEVKHHLSSLPSSEFQQAAFLSAKSRHTIQRKSSKTYTDAAEKKKVCNWCKKHGFPCEGHLWFQCRRLKEEQAKRKKQKEKDQKDQKGKGKADKDIKSESAHVSMEVQQQSSSQFEPLSGQQSVGSNQPSAGTDQPSAGTDVALTAVSKHHHKHENDWIFDTAASSNMTSNLGS